MDTSRKIILSVLLLSALVVGGILLWPEAAEKLAPEPVAAWVAIQPAGEEAARIGSVELPAGSELTLHAVLEARGRGGAPLYYTEAERLIIDGAEVPAESILRWDRPRPPKLRWFTVEGAVPYLRVDGPDDLDRFEFKSFFRVSWPQTWSVPGRIDPANDDELAVEEGRITPDFGTQRYAVFIEFFAEDDAPLAERRYNSPAAEEMRTAPEKVATVRQVLAAEGGGTGAAAARLASSFFGVTQLDLAPDASADSLSRVRELTDRGLAYDTTPLLARLIHEAGREPGSLAWRRIDLATGALRWGTDVAAGDLVQAGSRWVMLYEDRGESGGDGVLGYEDLCLDFTRGAEVRPLSAVFAAGGELELGRLSG